jgi:hypothetical protein
MSFPETMTAFSFSAPHLSAEEERRELEDLTVDERLVILRDVYGSVGNYLKQREKHSVANHASACTRRNDDAGFDQLTPSCAQDSETKKRSLELFNEALEAALHQFGVTASLEACVKCPELISLEFSPHRFLECANFDVRASASRVPYISLEEERQEVADLTDDERRRIRLDLYGVGDAETTADQPKMAAVSTEFALAAYRKALSALMIQNSTAYETACQMCPDLVESESNPLDFLRCEDGDAVSAADRAVRYWDWRLRFFGEERAFLPMTLEGAMRADCVNLRKGFIFPVPQPDRYGRSVVFIDRIRANKCVAPRDAVNRCIFYVLHCVAQRCCRSPDPYKGFVVLCNFRVSKR